MLLLSFFFIFLILNQTLPVYQVLRMRKVNIYTIFFFYCTYAILFVSFFSSFKRMLLLLYRNIIIQFLNIVLWLKVCGVCCWTFSYISFFFIFFILFAFFELDHILLVIFLFEQCLEFAWHLRFQWEEPRFSLRNKTLSFFTLLKFIKT